MTALQPVLFWASCGHADDDSHLSEQRLRCSATLLKRRASLQGGGQGGRLSQAVTNCLFWCLFWGTCCRTCITPASSHVDTGRRFRMAVVRSLACQDGVLYGCSNATHTPLRWTVPGVVHFSSTHHYLLLSSSSLSFTVSLSHFPSLPFSLHCVA